MWLLYAKSIWPCNAFWGSHPGLTLACSCSCAAVLNQARWLSSSSSSWWPRRLHYYLHPAKLALANSKLMLKFLLRVASNYAWRIVTPLTSAEDKVLWLRGTRTESQWHNFRMGSGFVCITKFCDVGLDGEGLQERVGLMTPYNNSLIPNQPPDSWH